MSNIAEVTVNDLTCAQTDEMAIYVNRTFFIFTVVVERDIHIHIYTFNFQLADINII